MGRVFISHRGSDTAEAERLAAALAERGHVVRFDSWELVAGDSIIAWMNEGLESAGFVALCYSKAGVDAPWISREWMSALARQLDGHPITLLPVRLTGRQGPAIIADLKATDWMADPVRAVDELHRAIGVIEGRRRRGAGP